MEISPGLYVYLWQRQGNNSNTYAIKYIVEGKPRFLLIDPGHAVVLSPSIDVRGRIAGYYEEDALTGLLKAMEKDGIGIDDVGLIILTHCHPDHCQAGFRLSSKSSLRLAFHELEVPLFQKISEDAEDEKENRLSQEDKGGKLPHLYIQEGELVLGRPEQVILKVLHTPGHSPGSLSLYWAEKKALIAGDVVFYRNTGRYDLPGGNLSLLRESIVRLSNLDVEYLLTGHAYGHPGVIYGKKEVELNFKFILSQVLP